MRQFALCFTLVVLLFSACSKNNTQPNNNPTNQPNTDTPNTSNTPPKLEVVTAEPPKEHVPKPPLDGKTATDVFKHLKEKGWKLNESANVDIPPFGSEEAIAFNRPDKVGFLILRFDTLDTAQSKFKLIDGVYRSKFGRAITAKNFTIAIFGGQIRINAPDFKQLSEDEYLKLQQDLVEFCNL